MKQVTQIKMAKILGITPAYMSELISGKHPVSWPIAAKLSELFPGRSIKEWKYAKPVEVKKAFLTKIYSEDVEQH